jgi:hypothetical protein
MAKKPETKKSETKKPEAKKSEGKKREFRPATGKFVYVEFGDLVTILSMINEHGQAAELAALTKGSDHVVRVPSGTANAVKKFIAEHPEMSEHPTGEKVLGPAPTEEAPQLTTRGARPVASGVNVVPRNLDCRCGFCPGG